MQAPDGQWFATTSDGSTDYLDGIFAAYLAAHPVRANQVAVFVTHNLVLCSDFGGCILGYHNAQFSGQFYAGKPTQNTYLWASWLDQDTSMWSDPKDPKVAANFADIHTFSHELGEWMNDPYVNNTVPSYNSGYGGCSTILETGDQLVGKSVPITLNGKVYHPQTQDIVQYFLGPDANVPAIDGTYIFPKDRTLKNVPADRTGC